jgi:putative CocE/NonD family hydrolase
MFAIVCAMFGRRLGGALLGAVCAAVVAAPAAPAATVVEDADFVASDGVTLHATVSGEAPLVPRPLVVEYSPYGQAPGGPPTGTAFNYVHVHARGTGESGGAWDIMGPREQADIAESLQFFCDKPWSNGRIGLFGFSASAIAAYTALRNGPLPCVETAGLLAGTSSIYRDLIFIGGMPNFAPATVVSAGIAGGVLSTLPGRMDDDPTAHADTPRGVVNALEAFGVHQTEDEFWRQRTFPGPAGVPDVPILAATGFYDVESRGPFETWKAMKENGSHLLVIGAHDGAAGGSGGVYPQFQRWFEHYLLDADNGIDSEAPVQLYVGHGSHENLIGGQWTKVDAEDWPVPGTSWTPLHLDPAASGSATSINDGTLSLEKPGTASTAVAPNVPSNTFATDPYTTATVTQTQDTRLTEATSLTWTTPPLAQPVMSVGPAALKLRLTSTSPETDIVAVLTDVAPDGATKAVAAGRLRSSFPAIDEEKSVRDPDSGAIVQPYNDLSAKQTVLPGTAQDYHVEFWPIGNRFEAGHRLRLILTGTPVSFLPSAPAINSVVVGGPDGATLQLPVLPGSAPVSFSG